MANLIRRKTGGYTFICRLILRGLPEGFLFTLAGISSQIQESIRAS
jgi:hypothetical protein